MTPNLTKGCVAALFLLFPVTLYAQAWPTKPVRVIVTFTPGGSSDVEARLISGPLQQKLGQTVVVDNKPGAGGTIGAAEASRAAADGYTFLLSNSAPISISPFMLEKAPYDPVKSFNHIAYIGSVANVLVVHPSVPAKSVRELVVWIKAQKDPVNYGSGGIGSIGHIIGEVFKNAHKLQVEHIGYKGSAPMLNDLIGGRLRFAFDTLPQNVPHMQEGRLRALAVTSVNRAAIAPDVPTVIEAGEPNLVAENFLGLSAPAGVRPDIAIRLHGAMTEVLVDAGVVKRLSEIGVDGRKMSVAEFNAFVAKQVTDWAPLVRASGAKLN
ncbi:MAG: tripartite tricarboxylate transporter substrate binding protein [Betaproteobacteria bacterium]|nr:tripartite tricarboxylate transporter substrate binding protein [Betaproteobacteria bacterium]